MSLTSRSQHGGLQLKARRAIARQIEGRFSTAYVLPNSLKSALLPLLAGIPKRVGYLGEGAGGLADPPPEKPQEQARPWWAFYSALSGESGLEADPPRAQAAPRPR
jgi:heptosyltransferase-2